MLLWLFVFVVVVERGSGVIPPAAPHICQPPYKGQIPDIFCNGQFRYDQIMCGPGQFDPARTEALYSREFRDIRFKCGFYTTTVFQMRQDTTNLLPDDTGIYRLIPVSIVSHGNAPSSDTVCRIGQPIMLRIDGVGGNLPGYLPGCTDWKTGQLVEGCLPGRFHPPECRLTCPPEANECGMYGDCVFRPGMAAPACLCHNGVIGYACQFNCSICISSAAMNQKDVCSNRGQCLLG
jgi:hypothetical protein